MPLDDKLGILYRGMEFLGTSAAFYFTRSDISPPPPRPKKKPFRERVKERFENGLVRGCEKQWR